MGAKITCFTNMRSLRNPHKLCAHYDDDSEEETQLVDSQLGNVFNQPIPEHEEVQFNTAQSNTDTVSDTE